MNSTRTNLSRNLILFITPILLMEFQIISNSNSRPALMIGILQLIIFVGSVKHIKYSVNAFFNKQSLYYLGILTIFSGLILFSVNFTYLKSSAFRSSFLFLAPSIMLVILALSDSNKKQTFRTLSIVLTLFGSFISLYGITIYLFGRVSHNTQFIELGNIQFSQVVMGINRDRISSVTSNPNVLGSLLMLTIPMTFYNILETKKDYKFLVLIIIQLIALFMTQSRASIIGLFMMVLIYSFESSRRKMKFYYTGFALISIGVIAFVIFGEVALGRLADGLNGREEQWGPLIESILQYPFTGVGFGLADVVIINRETHNVYLNVLAEMGVFGLISFVYIWFIGIRSNYRKIYRTKTNNENANQLTIIFSVLCGLIVHQFFETDLLQYDFITLFWVYLITYSIQPHYTFSTSNKKIKLFPEMIVDNYAANK